MIHSRGYSDTCHKTLETAYYNKPTALQMASYRVYLTELVRDHKVETFRDIMQSGISLNPCNSRGESLLHTICRRGNVELLRVLLELGCSLQVSDDYGRTPLHDACWSVHPRFDVIELILQQDRHLLHLADCRGATPLSYVRKENWAAFLTFLGSQKDILWPPRGKKTPEAPPELVVLPPNSRPYPDPDNALPTDCAVLVASGKLFPWEAEILRNDGILEEGSDQSEDDGDDDGDDDDDDDSIKSFESGDEDDNDINLAKELIQFSNCKGSNNRAVMAPSEEFLQSSWGVVGVCD